MPKGIPMSDEKKLALKKARSDWWEKERERRKIEKERIDSLPPEERASMTLSKERSTQKFGNFRGGQSPDPKKARELVVREISRNRVEILKAQIELAKGLNYVNKEGELVYTKLPVPGTGEYLLNQLIGKPTESMEIKQITKIQVDI